MSALAHYFESEGLATTTIALIRQHAERIRPPRTLWVPFELGRPVGPPLDADFQRRVVQAALALLDRDDGPVVLEDFPDEAPGEDGDPQWQPPPVDSSGDLLREIASLAELASETAARRGYASGGLTGLDVATAARYIECIDSESPLDRPTKRLAPVQILRFGADDLKAYYCDAALASGVIPSSRQVWGWFWRETLAGKALLKLRAASAASESESRQGIARSLVPVLWQEDEAVIARL